MYMKRILCALALAGLIAPVAGARTLSADEAKANVAAALSDGLKKAPALKGQLTLQRTISHNGMPALYIFSGAGDRGFVVASASSETPAVLGYADTEFDPASIPPAMQAMLDGYSAEIAQVEGGQVRTVYALPAPQRDAIAPLCKTQWNQNAPYNDLTPMLSGQHCMTGCVATAMAQVMKTFEWPAEHGEGFTSYTWTLGGETLSYNLAKSNLDWPSMLDNYRGESTAAQKEAVATLMRDCGYATSMQYSLTSSGTTANTIPTALYYNFGYDKGVHTLQRAFYTLSEWENIVYTELQNGRPVIFTGVSSSQGGHCFVCDGYSSDRYYHINWGWGGMSDGYFLLSAMTPQQQGIGGSTGGFNNAVNACVGIGKPVEGSVFYTSILADGNLTTSQTSYNTLQSVDFNAEAFYNPTMQTENVYLGVKLTDSEGKVSYLPSGRMVKLDTYEMVNKFNVSSSSFPASGTYTVTAAWRNADTDEWKDVDFTIDASGELKLTVADGTLTFESVPVEYDVHVDNVKILTDLYTNTNFRVSGEIVNSGDSEFLGEVMAAVIDGDDRLVGQTAPFNVDVEGGQTQSLDFVTKFASPVPAAGTYYFCFVTTQGEIISEPFEVTMSALSGATSIALQNLRFTSGDGASTPTVPSNDVSVAGSLYCSNGYFNNTLTSYIFPQRGGNSLATIGAETLFVHEGESADFAMKGSFGNGVVGDTYMVGFFNDRTQVQGVLYFVLGEESTGIEMVETPEGVSLYAEGDSLILSGAEASRIDVYGVDGSHVLSVFGTSAGLGSLVPGTYVAVARTAQGPVMAKFVR